MPNTSQELFSQIALLHQQLYCPHHPLLSPGVWIVGGKGEVSTHRQPSGDNLGRGQRHFLQLCSPSTPQSSPSPPLGWSQLSQQGQEEKTSYQLQAERAGRPGCSPVPQRYLHHELAPGTPILAAAHRSHVPLHVESEMVRAGESPLAEVALEGPMPCVLAVVAGQLIRASKFPATAFPGAVVGLLTCRGEGVSVALKVLHPPCAITLLFPCPRLHFSEGSLPTTLGKVRAVVYSFLAHLCLLYLSFCPSLLALPHVLHCPMCPAWGGSSGHPCPTAALLHMTLPRFKLWVLPHPSLTSCRTTCSVLLLTGVSPYTPVCLPTPFFQAHLLPLHGSPGPPGVAGCHGVWSYCTPYSPCPPARPHHWGPSEHFT